MIQLKKMWLFYLQRRSTNPLQAKRHLLFCTSSFIQELQIFRNDELVTTSVPVNYSATCRIAVCCWENSLPWFSRFVLGFSAEDCLSQPIVLLTGHGKWMPESECIQMHDKGRWWKIIALIYLIIEQGRNIFLFSHCWLHCRVLGYYIFYIIGTI